MMYSRGLVKQHGFLLPVALMLVVGIAALAIGISKLNSQSSVSSFREAISLQAFYAAESGMQYGMNQVMYPTADRTQSTTNCATLSGRSITFTATGLNGCVVDISCASSINDADTTTFFELSSSASCGSGELLSERVIRASAYINE